MVFSRCWNFDDNGMPIGKGCPKGGNCPFVHPSHPTDWSRAPRFNTRPQGPKSRRAGYGQGKGNTRASAAGPSNTATSSAEASRAASPAALDSASFGDSLGTSSWGVRDNGWGTERTAGQTSGSPAILYTGFNEPESNKGKEKLSSPAPIVPSEPAVPPPPPPPEDPDAPPVLSPVLPRTPVKSNKFSNAGFIDRSNLENREPGVLSSPASAPPVNRAPPGPPNPVSLSEVHKDSERFIRQLLDAVFKTQELTEAEERLARTKQLVYSQKYERASHATRLELEKVRHLAEEDRFIKDDRLRSRLDRIAELPNVGPHLAEIAPAMERSNTEFGKYLESVEAWREGLEPYVRGLWEAYKEKIRKREEELAKDDRPDWIKNVLQLKGQYDRLVELERSVNDFILEHEDHEMQADQSLLDELIELAEEGNQQLRETVERAKQEKVDARVKQMSAERKLRDAELRRKMDGLGDTIGAGFDKEAQREPRTGLDEYMADIRERVRQHHAQHAERIQAIKTQHTGVDELLKQTEPTMPYDLPKLISETEMLVKRRVDEQVAQAVGQLRQSSENILTTYETQQVRFLWESSEPIRLVAHYVDNDDGRKSQTNALLQEQMSAQAPSGNTSS
ncbi:hypothetical protein PENSPDRAFT_747191 [Peniophora sp. CONT]|nr:hypothetical protein PENSPDRAFT_747191 [Peniophora sp. CONT]